MSKLLVTGYKGWIGRNFTKILDDNHVEWKGIDRLDGDDLLVNFQPFYDALDECDVVVHLAATARIPPSWVNSAHYVENNVGITNKVAEACAARGKYLVFASSSSIYGNGTGPLNPYAWTKEACEQCIAMYGRTKQLNYTIARLFTNYGEDDNSGLVIGRWLNLAKQGQPVPIRGTGEQDRDFIHVSDTAAGLLAICNQQPYRQTVDLGTGNSIKLVEIADILGVARIYEPELDGYAASTKASIEHTQKYINWSSRVDLRRWLNDQLAK